MQLYSSKSPVNVTGLDGLSIFAMYSDRSLRRHRNMTLQDAICIEGILRSAVL